MSGAPRAGRRPGAGEPAPPRLGYREFLSGNRNFRFLWGAEIISFLGDWFNTIALYTIVLELSGTGRAVAALLVAKTLPAFLVTPLAGPLIDRFDRRRILILSDVLRALLAGGLILAARLESLPLLYVCQVVMVAATGVFFPARSAAIPQICAGREIAVANALSGATWSVMLALGAALGGWATAALGTETALALDSLTFLASAAFLLALPRLPAPAAEAGHDRSFVAGIRHLAAERRTLALASLKPMLALGGGALLLIPVFGTSYFPGRGGPLWMGLLYAARGVGALIGSVALIRVFGDSSRTLRRAILVMFPVGAAAYLSLLRVSSFEAAAAAYFVSAIAGGAVWVLSGTLLQREGDPRYLGRIFSVEFGSMTLVVSAMSWIAGEALDRTSLGPREVAGLSGLLLLIPFLVWGGYLLAERRRAAAVPDAASAPEVPSAPHVPPEL